MALEALEFVAPGAWNNRTGMNKLRKNDLIHDGALICIDLSNSFDPLPAGVPADGASIPNLAFEEAAVTIGSGTQSTLASTFVNQFNSATYAVFERTAKGGLHGMISQLADAPTSHRTAYIKQSTVVRGHIFANPSHDFFAVKMGRVTRAAKTGAATQLPIMGIVKDSSSTSSLWFLMDMAATRPLVTFKLGTVSDLGLNTVGANYFDIAVSDYTGVAPAAAVNVLSYLPAWGAPDSFASFGTQYSQSHSVDIIYVEDLTISGRTYAAATADAHAYFTTEYGAGGRFYGDTFSDPATVCP